MKHIISYEYYSNPGK